MSTFVVALLLSLAGCGATDEAETAAADAATTAQATKAKGAKGKKGAKGRKGAKGQKASGKQAKRGKGKKGGSANAKPLGEAGPMVGTLKLTEVEATAPPAGAAAATTTEPAPAVTEAELLLTFGEGQEEAVKLGKVPGNCAEIDPSPVGPEGKERTPLWAVECMAGELRTDLVIMQAGETLAVLKSAPESETKGIGFRPVRRVRLAKGVELTKGS